LNNLLIIDWLIFLHLKKLFFSKVPLLKILNIIFVAPRGTTFQYLQEQDFLLNVYLNNRKQATWKDKDNSKYNKVVDVD